MIINFGSINIDHVYRVAQLPQPGETLTAETYEKFLGGKGINQSIAIVKAGGQVMHVGAVGKDGDWAMTQIAAFGVASDAIARIDAATGHAVIVVDAAAENQIVIVGGANQCLQTAAVDQALATADPEQDWVLLQNETNLATYIVEQAARKQLRIAYAAAPFVAHTTLELLPKIELLAVNAGEAEALAQHLDCDAAAIPVPQLLITRGAAGAEWFSRGQHLQQAALPVRALDSTGAGDTFLGSFFAQYSLGQSPQHALHYAAAASALQVTRAGAAQAIPAAEEVQAWLRAKA